MKLLICGKGGAGKSTITTLLARQYAASGKRVVVVDADVSNRGLHRILGVEAPPDFTGNFPHPPRRPMNERPPRDASRMERPRRFPMELPPLGTWTYDTIPADYCSASNGIKLLAIGKIHTATEYGKGRWVGLARRFLAGLQLSEQERLIVDTDAGVEHLARGLGGSCDAILVVVDPSYESILMTKTVSRMMAPLNRPLFLILNKTNAITSKALRNALGDIPGIIGEFSQDARIFHSGLSGAAMLQGSPTAAAALEKIENFCAC